MDQQLRCDGRIEFDRDRKCVRARIWWSTRRSPGGRESRRFQPKFLWKPVRGKNPDKIRIRAKRDPVGDRFTGRLGHGWWSAWSHVWNSRFGCGPGRRCPRHDTRRSERHPRRGKWCGQYLSGWGGGKRSRGKCHRFRGPDGFRRLGKRGDQHAKRRGRWWHSWGKRLRRSRFRGGRSGTVLRAKLCGGLGIPSLCGRCFGSGRRCRGTEWSGRRASHSCRRLRDEAHARSGSSPQRHHTARGLSQLVWDELVHSTSRLLATAAIHRWNSVDGHGLECVRFNLALRAADLLRLR